MRSASSKLLTSSLMTDWPCSPYKNTLPETLSGLRFFPLFITLFLQVFALWGFYSSINIQENFPDHLENNHCTRPLVPYYAFPFSFTMLSYIGFAPNLTATLCQLFSGLAQTSGFSHTSYVRWDLIHATADSRQCKIMLASLDFTQAFTIWL